VSVIASHGQPDQVVEGVGVNVQVKFFINRTYHRIPPLVICSSLNNQGVEMCNIQKLHGEIVVLVEELNLLVAKAEAIKALAQVIALQTEKDEPEVTKGGDYYD